MWSESLSFLIPLVNPLGSSGKTATLNFKIMSVEDGSVAVQGPESTKTWVPMLQSAFGQGSHPAHMVFQAELDTTGSTTGHKVLLVPVTIPQADTS